jgi:hypothetical protein
MEVHPKLLFSIESPGSGPKAPTIGFCEGADGTTVGFEKEKRMTIRWAAARPWPVQPEVNLARYRAGELKTEIE